MSKVPSTCLYFYTPATLDAARRIPPASVAADEHTRGMRDGDALIVAIDALNRYAEAYAEGFGDKLCTDYVLGPAWLSSIANLRELLNGNGSEAMRRGMGRDSKDNGACESVFWSAMRAAGFTEDDLNNRAG